MERMTRRFPTALRVLGLTVALAAGLAAPALAQEGPLDGGARPVRLGALRRSARDAERRQAAGERQPDQSPLDRAVPLALPAGARTRRRSRSGDCRGRRLGSDVSADRDGGLAARAHGVLGSAPAPAARHRAHALRRRRRRRSTGRTIRPPNSSSASCCASSTIPTWADGWATCACWSRASSTSARLPPRRRPSRSPSPSPREEAPPPAPRRRSLPDPQKIYTSDDEGVVAVDADPPGSAARAAADRAIRPAIAASST